MDSNETRGIFAGGKPSGTNTIEYITIAATGNAIDFGDTIIIMQNGSSISTRGIIAGGYGSPAKVTQQMHLIILQYHTRKCSRFW